jgi:hypothetical protein
MATTMRLLKIIPASVAALALMSTPAGAAELRAGVGMADITPENGGTTLGFVRPDIMVKGIHTRLMGRVLVLDDGDTKVALLSTDLAYPLSRDSLVSRVKDLGFDHSTILYTGTHTHSGPGDLADWQVEQLAKAIRAANASLEPAKAAWGSQRVLDVNRNRSIEAHLANHGIEQFYGEGHPEDDPGGAEHSRDTRLRILRVDTAAGKPLAGWIHFPVHLTTSAPDVDIWDTDLAGAATHHFEEAVGGPSFTAMYTNGALGDQMPRFDSFNRTATMDLHGRRIAQKAYRAWRAAGKRLKAKLDVATRWTRSCYCGQEVEPGHSVSDQPVWGLPFLGGSEDGASIFHEAGSTEGKRLPESAADPVHGRKIRAAPGLVHETVPEFEVFRIGDRLLLGTPGEPSVEMGRRLEAAARPELPAGVKEPVVIGLANNYMGYLVTPEEYEMQHYEGGHTVFGIYTSILAKNSLVSLTRALRMGEPAPAPDEPAGGGSTDPGAPFAGGSDGSITAEPAESVRRMDTVTIGWSGTSGGVDRPVDNPFVTLERQVRGKWRLADSDLGLSFIWREDGGSYSARYEIPPGQELGAHRLRIRAQGYDLMSRPFAIGRAQIRLRGVLARKVKRGWLLSVVAQNPPPDPEQAVVWRSTTPSGGAALLRYRGTKVRARWNSKRQAWTIVVPRKPRTVTVLRLRDAFGNRIAKAARVRVGALAELEWPTNIGVGDGRTPGALGEGQFPP